jgi:RNase P/RNase MRP subunit p29
MAEQQIRRERDAFEVKLPDGQYVTVWCHDPKNEARAKKWAELIVGMAARVEMSDDKKLVGDDY